MKLAVVQLNPRVGDLRKNTESILSAIAEAQKSGVDLLLFPELAVCGYPPRDLLDYPRFVQGNLDGIHQIAKSCTQVAVLVGFVEKNPSNEGAPFFNSAALLKDGKVHSIYRKRLLPVYDVFDERRYFQPGNSPLIFELCGKRVGVTICEDAWNFPGFGQRMYPHQPLQDLVGVDLVVNLSASPFHLGKPALRHRLFQEAAKFVGCPVLHCNQVGGNDDLLFDGCSLLAHPDGKVEHGPAFQEGVWIFAKNPAPSWPETDEDWLIEALVLGIRDYCLKSGVSKVCLGLSGGIDSAVTACLAVMALGPDSVSALGLPTRFTSKMSREDSADLAKNLGIQFREISVDGLFEVYQQSWKESFSEKLATLTLENLQPRIRMTLLMALANQENRLLLNTSNKSEIAVGYATLYGDSAGAVSVLGDLLKGQVYQLASAINRRHSWIPVSTIERPPTAELREGQLDSESLPDYPVLDQMVVEVVEKGASEEDLVARGFDKEAVSRFCRLHRQSEYKRFQLPPVLRVSPHAFGTGRRLPLAAEKPF